MQPAGFISRAVDGESPSTVREINPSGTWEIIKECRPGGRSLTRFYQAIKSTHAQYQGLHAIGLVCSLRAANVLPHGGAKARSASAWGCLQHVQVCSPPSPTCNFTPSRWRRPWCGLRSQAVDRTRTLGRAAAAGGAQFIHRRSRGMRPLVLCAPAARLKLILTRRLSRASEVSIASSPMLSTMRPACSGGSSFMW